VNVNIGSTFDLLIIGGSSSLGDAIIAHAIEQKLSYLATSRDLAKETRDPNHFLTLDLASISSVENFLHSLDKCKFNNIIYCIGAVSGIRLETLEVNQLEKYFNEQLVNAVYLIGKLCAYLDDSKTSTIGVVSSRSALYPSFDFCYAGMKGALASFVSSLSKQLPANKKSLVIAPGALLHSKMFNQMPKEIQKSHLDRSNESLLSVANAASQILNILTSNFESGSVVEIGPSYK